MISFSNITKRFPGVAALSDVTFDVASGACHAICGENGAGKSTLGKTLAGIHTPDGGTIMLDGRVVRFESRAKRSPPASRSSIRSSPSART